MRIHAVQNHYEHQQKPEEIGSKKAQQNTPVTGIEPVADKAATPSRQDEYISSEKASEKPSGLYRVIQDEKGNRKILYDDPKKIQEAKEEHANTAMERKAQDKASGEQAEKCTANTDQVDREIEALKEKQKQLMQQIKAASGDNEKIRELEKKLANIEKELTQKDNDAYRRQNASFS